MKSDNLNIEDVELDQVIAKQSKEDQDFKNLLKNQDSKQKLNMMLSYTMELYKCLMSSLLTVFVPQSCGDKICSISENFSRGTVFGYFTLSFNFFSLLVFLILYFNEAKREFRLIHYLDVNHTKPRDNNAVEQSLLFLSNYRKDNLVVLDKYYMYSGFISLGVFVFNLIFSIIFISTNYLDSQTITVFLTNIIFMGSKLYDIYSIIDTEKYVFLSAYLRRKVQFNDVDPDKKELNYIFEPGHIEVEKAPSIEIDIGTSD